MSERLRQLETGLTNARNAGNESAARMFEREIQREAEASERLRQLETGLTNARNAGDELAARMFEREIQRERQNISPAEMQRQRAGMQLVEEINGVKIYKTPDGEETAVTDRFSTGDPEQIARIREGRMIAPSGEQAGRQFAGEQLRSTPLGAAGTRAAQFVSGVPYIGEGVDELMGSLLGPGARETIRGATEQYETERPFEAGVTKLAGTVTGLVGEAAAAGPALVSKGVTLPQKVVNNIMTIGGLSAIEGAMTGYLSGEGQQEREGQAVVQGTIGAAFGSLFGLGVPLAGEKIKNLLSPYAGKTASQISNELGISKRTAGVILRAVRNDDFDAAVVALNRAGQEVSLADASSSFTNLLQAAVEGGETAARTARDTVTNRAQRAGENFQKYLNATLGDPEFAGGIKKSIMSSSESARREIYQEAYETPIDYTTDSGVRLQDLLTPEDATTPTIPQSLLNRARLLMQLRGIPSGQISIVPDEAGNMLVTKLPSPIEWDFIKRAAQDSARKARRAGRSDEALGYEGISREIRENLSENVPAYASALNLAGDVIQDREAVDVGYDLLSSSTTIEDVTESLSGAPRSQINAARRGLRASLDEQMSNVRSLSNNPAKVDQAEDIIENFTSEAAKRKLKILLGEEGAEEFNEEVAQTIAAIRLDSAVTRRLSTTPTQVKALVGEEVVKSNILNNVLIASLGGRSAGRERTPIVGGLQVILEALTGRSESAMNARAQGLYEDIAEFLVDATGPKAQESLAIIRRAINEGRKPTESEASIIANYFASRASVELTEPRPTD